MPAGADQNSSINILLARWQVSYYLLSKTTNGVPTDLSPVERVDAAGRAVVHQSWFGSAGCRRKKVVVMQVCTPAETTLHSGAWTLLQSHNRWWCWHLWDMSRFPLYEKCGMDLIRSETQWFQFYWLFSILYHTGVVSSAFSFTFSPAWNIWPAQFWPEKWVRRFFFLVSKTFSKENFCHD